MSYADFRYQEAPKLSPTAISDYQAVMSLKDHVDRSAGLKSFVADHVKELSKRRHILMENISNFSYLVDRYQSDQSFEIKNVLTEYAKYPGFEVCFNPLRLICHITVVLNQHFPDNPKKEILNGV